MWVVPGLLSVVVVGDWETADRTAKVSSPCMNCEWSPPLSPTRFPDACFRSSCLRQGDRPELELWVEARVLTH